MPRWARQVGFAQRREDGVVSEVEEGGREIWESRVSADGFVSDIEDGGGEVRCDVIGCVRDGALLGKYVPRENPMISAIYGKHGEMQRCRNTPIQPVTRAPRRGYAGPFGMEEKGFMWGICIGDQATGCMQCACWLGLLLDTHPRSTLQPLLDRPQQ
jgi:hypothetical protein